MSNSVDPYIKNTQDSQDTAEPVRSQSEHQKDVQNLEIKNIFSSLDASKISNVLDKISQNPEEISKLIDESMNNMNITPEIVDQAKKIAASNQGTQILNEMKKKGINPNSLRSQVKNHQKNMRLINRQNEITRKAILVTSSRQLKSRDVPSSQSNNVKTAISKILKTDNPIEIGCSRLAQGSLKEKTVKVWYDPVQIRKNRRASVMTGFPVGGEILIVIDNYDLTEKDILEVETFLC